MDITTKDLNLLRVFHLLSEERSLSITARRLHLSQPALSYQLKRLREEFKDPLFVRTSQGYRLTERALEIAPQIKSIIMSVEGLYSKADFDLKTHHYQFKLAATSYFEATIMNPLLKTLKEKAPFVTLSTFSLIDKTPLRELEMGHCDLAVATFFDEVPKSFHKKVIGKDHQVCLMRKKHPFLNGKGDLKSYLEFDHIKIDVPAGSTSRIDHLLKAKRMGKRKIVGRFNNFLTPLLVLNNSDYILTIPEKFALNFAKAFQLEVAPLPSSKIELEIQMLWHDVQNNDPFQIWIRDTIQSLYGMQS